MNFFDHAREAETTNLIDGSYGELTSATHVYGEQMNPRPDGLYHVRGQLTPDSVWGPCGTQFRLVNYFELSAVNYEPDDAKKFTMRTLLSRRSNSGPQTIMEYAHSANDDQACADATNAVQGDPRFLPDVPVLIFFPGAAAFPRTKEAGRGLPSRHSACVSFQGARASGSNVYLSHELGHAVGLEDVGGECSTPAERAVGSVMCQGGGEFPPTAFECFNEGEGKLGMKTKANTHSARFFPR